VRGSVTISGSGNWCVQNTRVDGVIKIANGANVLIENVTVSGGISARNGGVFALCGSSVKGVSAVSEANGFVLIGDPGDDRCEGNTLRGWVVLNSNRGGLEVSHNTFQGELRVSATSGDGAAHGGFPEDHGSEISANTVRGLLACFENAPPPSNDGQPNHATLRRGQCASPDF
jgi:hypothetical protein